MDALSNSAVDAPRCHNRRGLLFMEITQARKEAEEKLAANESLLRLSQEAGHIGSYDWDIGGGHNYWSDEQCRLHGIEPSGGKSIPIEAWRRVVHPDDLDAVERKIREIIERGGSSSSIESSGRMECDGCTGEVRLFGRKVSRRA